MAAPEGQAVPSPPPPRRMVRVLSRQPLTVGRAARIIAFATVSVMIVSGIVIHFTDSQRFSDIWDGWWWAIQTVTTVGYGDVVPRSTAGRLVATLVMLFGIGFLTVITAAITSTFIEQARRQIRGSTYDTLSTQLDQIGARLDGIEAALAAGSERQTPGRDPKL
jgi:voltage-gated potassium channel